jgi:nucleoside phosphorylase
MESPKTDARNLAPVGVFTALAWESVAVRSVLKRVTKIEEHVWRGFAGDQEFRIITGGIGPRRTRQTVERFATTPFSAVLSVGCAGALVPGLTTGQLILASDIRLQPTKEDDRLELLSVDATLLARTRTAADRSQISVANGPLFTSPKVLFTPEEKAAQGVRTGAIAVEMESGVHASFAAERGLPFLVLRIILDGVDMTIPAVAGLTTPEGEVRPLRAAAYVATHPHHLPALLAIKRAREAAARTISRLCRELLPQLNP